jgi:hypothetical protein
MFPPPKPAAAQKPPVMWTIMPMPGIAFQAWADGSIKIQFPADRAEEVLEHFKTMIGIMEQGAHMIKNPPKKCPGCRGQGQIVVKNGNERTQEPCPQCKGSGMKGLLIPTQSLPVSPAKLMTRNVGHTTPLPEPLLPHQTEVDPQLKNETTFEPPTTQLREVDKEDLEEFTD